MDSPARFGKALPVWLKGLEPEMNISAGFRTAFSITPPTGGLLRVAACTVYRAWLNGNLLAHGPARAAHGWARVDEWPLDPLLKPGQNILAIEVAGYRANSYAWTAEAPFLQAEVVVNDTVVAATNPADMSFHAGRLRHRLQKVVRYSFQRPFAEVYRMETDSDRWRTNLGSRLPHADTVAARQPRLLPRRVPLPRLNCRQPVAWIAQGHVHTGPVPADPWRPRFVAHIGPHFHGFPVTDLEYNTIDELQRLTPDPAEPLTDAFEPESGRMIPADSWVMADFGEELTGFPAASVSCSGPLTLHFVFDEILTKGDIDFTRLTCVNAVTWHLQPGTYSLEAFEPYSLRYLKCLAVGGACTVRHLSLRELASPHADAARFVASDNRVNRVFEAARNTFRQNALDVFMDCPSRERAGWLGDSFFAARVENDLTGGHAIERSFLENFALAESFEGLPEGMIAMCYPSDHWDGCFIPNWGLWFILQLEEYAIRTGDRRMIGVFHSRVRRLLAYFQKFRNAAGLLEKLENWNFVEWSKANDFVQDVNTPTNMLFAAALDAAGRIYQDASLRRDAATVRDSIRQLMFDGTFFVDNAVRQDSRLVPTRNRTETCQYFAFFCDVATPESHPTLWQLLVHEFGPNRARRGLHPDIHPTNAFIGNYLRMEILSRYGEQRRLFDEILPTFLYMADQTGTLWENVGATASCNHGFAAHVARVFFRDVLGCRVDPVARQVALQPVDLPLEWCEGRIPLDGGFVDARWWKESGQLRTHLQVPAGYRRVVN